MSSCSVMKKQTGKPIRQVHTDRWTGNPSDKFTPTDELENPSDKFTPTDVTHWYFHTPTVAMKYILFYKLRSLKDNVEEKRCRKSVKTHATTPGWLLSGLSVCSTLAVMRPRGLFSTNFLERCTELNKTIAWVQFLLKWALTVLRYLWCSKWYICCGYHYLCQYVLTACMVHRGRIKFL